MVSSSDVGQNLEVAGRLLRESRRQDARVATLPENFAFMGIAEADKFAIAEDEGTGPIQSAIAEQARQLGLWIVARTLPLRVPGEPRLAAASLVFDDSGRQVARYDKIHLFDVDLDNGESYRESATIEPGGHAAAGAAPALRGGRR